MAKQADTGRILAFRNDRLGGRLNALLIAMRLARAYGVPFSIFWAISEVTSPELREPGDLFSQDFIERHFTTRETGTALLRHAKDISTLPADFTRDDFIRDLQSGHVFLANAATTQTLLPWEVPQDLAVLPQLMSEIGLNPAVRRAIAQIDARLRGFDFKSYHLRRGDIIDDATPASHNLWPDKYIPRVIYEWHMKRELERSDGPLIIFSDTPRETAAFSGLSPRVSSFDDLVGSVDPKPLQRDFLELYTMSRSCAIFAPPGSAFSGTAALLGNLHVTDITADLAPEDHDAAMDELVHRLENTPDVFLGQSDAGQNLPFIQRHLQIKGDPSRVTSIARNLVQRGMDRTYAYPFLSKRLLAAGDHDGCDDLIALLDQRLCYRDEHFSTVFLHGALADLARGNIARAIRRFHSGSWYFPINPLASEIFCYLATRNLTDQTNVHPYDPALMRRAGRIFDDGASPAQRLLMQQIRDDGDRMLAYPANMEVRDWRLLHGKKLSFRFSHPGRLAQQAGMLGQGLVRATGLRRAALTSAIGSLWAEAGETARAEPMLAEAIDANPDQPLYAKRHADLLLATARPAEALDMLQQAVVRSDDHPCYRACLALAHLSLKQVDDYVTIMTAIDLSDIPMPEMHLLQIDAARRRSDLLSGLPARLHALERMTPNNHRVLGLGALVHEQLGEWDEALSRLLAMRRLGRPETVLRPRLKRLFRSYCKIHDETGAKIWMASRGIAPELMMEETA